MKHKRKVNAFQRFLQLSGMLFCILISGCMETVTEPDKSMASTFVDTPVFERLVTEIGVVSTEDEDFVDTSVSEEKSFTIAISPVDGMAMVFVPEGEFLMGSLKGEGDRDEEPQLTIFLKAYWIDQYEVTNAMYASCVSIGVCSPPASLASYSISYFFGNPDYDDFPVVNVNWYQARKYCQWAGRSLPTEAQWEKAARGKAGAKYPWGNSDPDEGVANYSELMKDLSAVGSFPQGASSYGAMDMAGNAAEWVEDFYGNYPSTPYILTNPTGPATGIYRILRGGSWIIGPYLIRSSERFWASAFYADYDSGFRCALLQ